jgi:gamma-glutamylcyclotransferase
MVDYARCVSHAWYFAYGSNMQTATFCGRRGITFVRAMPARVAGWRLVLDKPGLLAMGEGFANLVPDESGAVIGVAYLVTSEDFETIDLTEGVLIGNYQRRAVQAVPLDGDTPPFDVFTLVSERRDESLRPSTRYMALLIEGAIEHGLPAEYIEFLRSISAEPPTRTAQALQPLVEQGLALLRKRRS